MKLVNVAHKLLELSTFGTAEQRGQADSSKIPLAAYFEVNKYQHEGQKSPYSLTYKSSSLICAMYEVKKKKFERIFLTMGSVAAKASAMLIIKSNLVFAL